ncbi:MAG: LLM class flavin-dependent oxidoreductase [Candidatus Kariarchaeaceae archaeon]|jgi:F420-dependent oxidoreductase-like protein
MSGEMIEVGLAVGADYMPVQEIVQVSPMLDQLGYAQVSIPEIWGHDAITLLSVLAHTTKKVRISTGIANIFSRSPGLMAMTAASLDELSNGRFVLGLGTSGPKVVEHWHGSKFSKPLKRTREYVELLRTMFSKEKLDHETETLGTYKDFKLRVKGVRADLPIHIASLGPKNVQLTAEIADGWIPFIMPINLLEKETKKIKEQVKSFGKDPEKFAITPFVLATVGTDPRQIELLRDHIFYYTATMGASKEKNFYNQMLRRSGFVDEADEIIDNFYQGDITASKKAVTDEIIDAMCIHGSIDQAQEKLHQFLKSGITCPILSLPNGSTAADAMKTFQSLGPINLSL